MKLGFDPIRHIMNLRPALFPAKPAGEGKGDKPALAVLAAALCILGALLVAAAPRLGPEASDAVAVAQGLWVVGNGAWLVVACRRRIWPLAAQYGVFLLLALWGLMNWRAA